MKKLTLVLLVATIFSLGFLSITQGVAYAEVSQSDCDAVFVSTLNELLDEEGSANAQISARKELLYDIHLQELGYLYSFEINGVEGFAIIIVQNDVYQCEEVYFDAPNPYGDLLKEELAVYITTMTYFKYDGIDYYDILQGAVVSQEALQELEKIAFKYAGGTTPTISNETINYSYKSKDEYIIVSSHPRLCDGSLQSNCVPVMAANIVQYYDRYSTDLLPNYDPGRNIGGNYIYNGDSATTKNLIRELYNVMGSDAQGTTVTEFHNGMDEYCLAKDSYYMYGSCMANGKLDYALLKESLKVNTPVALFLNPTYTIEEISENTNSDSVIHYNFRASHAMAVFGYRDITYTFANGSRRTDSYLKVATGYSLIPSGYCKISSQLAINDAYAVLIY